MRQYVGLVPCITMAQEDSPGSNRTLVCGASVAIGSCCSRFNSDCCEIDVGAVPKKTCRWLQVHEGAVKWAWIRDRLRHDSFSATTPWTLMANDHKAAGSKAVTLVAAADPGWAYSWIRMRGYQVFGAAYVPSGDGCSGN